MLSNKTSDLFAKWYQNNPNALPGLFDELPELVRLAYYVAFFDEQALIIEVTKWSDLVWQYFLDDGEHYPDNRNFNTRHEALTEAVTKANGILNLKLK